MIAEKIKYTQKHECIKIKQDIAVEQYSDGRVSHWYLNINDKLHGIKFCPYCGKNLYNE